MMGGHAVRLMMCGLRPLVFGAAVLAPALACTQADAQGVPEPRPADQRLQGTRVAGELTFQPTGPGVLFGALDPAVRKWYVPQELHYQYRWRSWEYTNYARNLYQRYVGTNREGDTFYDLYGNYVTRGWLLYDWSQTQPQQDGSNVWKNTYFRDWFSGLVVAADQKGQNHLAITIGDRIRSTLTPMTFSKPGFDGIQIDYQSDKYEVTTLLSRISYPGAAGHRNPSVQETTTSSTLTGGRATAQVGDFVKVGGTYVSAHNSTQLLDAFDGSPRSGSIVGSQNAQNVTKLFLRLSDDSPEDDAGGVNLFAWDVLIKADEEAVGPDGEVIVERTVVRASEVGLIPAPEGGFQRLGFVEASGSVQIELVYDFSLATYRGPDPSLIRELTFELAVANDYRIEVASDRQTDRAGDPVYLLAARAEGNVRDGSNLSLLQIPYGLPTATEVFGFTVEAEDVKGFKLYAEWDRSISHRKYPNRAHTRHLGSSSQGDAWMVNASKIAYPWFLFGEAYSMDHDYNTSAFLARGGQSIDYSDKGSFYYELVDDNDDQDRYPDWQRIFQASDFEVFPGYDENVDFVSDFNQNSTRDIPNLVPDYEEPFLRFRTDRPEFLFGVDMNNNLWVDRFENDDEADYPYGRDLRGYNVYAGADLIPGVRFTVGRTDESLIAGDGANTTNYAFFTVEQDYAGLGRLRFFESFRVAEDSIANDLRQWSDVDQGSVPTLDPLAARDTWINSTFFSFDYTRIEDLTFTTKAKYDRWHQRQEQPDLRDDSYFLGLINKIDHERRIARVIFLPRIKNELRLESPALKSDPRRREDTLLLSLLARWPLLDVSSMEVGVEYAIFNQLRESDAAVREGLLDDFSEVVGAVQFSTTPEYQGYKLHAKMGLRLTRRAIGGETETGQVAFAVVYAGLQ